MSKRKKVPSATVAQVLVQSRRRCCVCFGLYLDDSVKRGQVTHLDGDPSNTDPDNLAFICFNHHDEYDSTTSQSKGLTLAEVKTYRAELYAHFETWTTLASRENLLNFLASTIDLEGMADAAIKVAGQVLFYAAEHAYDVLVSHKVDYCDAELYTSHLVVLDHYASWGWLTFEEEQRTDEHGHLRVYITVEHKLVCRKVAQVVRQRIMENGGNLGHLEQIDARSKEALERRKEQNQ